MFKKHIRGDLRAVPITHAKTVKSVEKFREKYGAKDVKKYYPKFDVAVLVKSSRPPDQRLIVGGCSVRSTCRSYRLRSSLLLKVTALCPPPVRDCNQGGEAYQQSLPTV